MTNSDVTSALAERLAAALPDALNDVLSAHSLAEAIADSKLLLDGMRFTAVSIQVLPARQLSISVGCEREVVEGGDLLQWQEVYEMPLSEQVCVQAALTELLAAGQLPECGSGAAESPVSNLVRGEEKIGLSVIAEQLLSVVTVRAQQAPLNGRQLILHIERPVLNCGTALTMRLAGSDRDDYPVFAAKAKEIFNRWGFTPV